MATEVLILHRRKLTPRHNAISWIGPEPELKRRRLVIAKAEALSDAGAVQNCTKVLTTFYRIVERADHSLSCWQLGDNAFDPGFKGIHCSVIQVGMYQECCGDQAERRRMPPSRSNLIQDCASEYTRQD